MTQDFGLANVEKETLLPGQAEELLQRQQMLQEEAQGVVERLDLITVLGSVGTVRQVGSSTLGLMVWRDIDLAVSSPGISVERIYETMHSLFIHPYLQQVRYFNQNGLGNTTSLAHNDRYFFMLYYSFDGGPEWKIDISFWLAEGLHPEPMHEALEQQLTAETRLAILWIKNEWYQLPAYRTQVYSTDIYNAVLQYKVRTPTEFDQYLTNIGKPTRGDRNFARDEFTRKVD